MAGKEYWARKGDVKLFLWRKAARGAPTGTVLFVHGSSMASQPTFDLQVPGRPDSSVMDWFSARDFDCWCLDNEGYGRSDKSRPINFDIANGADDLAAASERVLGESGAVKLLVYGISSGALKAALFAGRLRALAVSTVKRSPKMPDVPTLAEAGLPGYEATIWIGLFAPAGTPRDILAKLFDEIGRVLSAPEAKASIGATGVEVALSPAEEFAAFVRAEHDKWGKVVRDTGATVN